MRARDLFNAEPKRHIGNLVRNVAWNNVTSPKTAARHLKDAGIEADPLELLRAANIHRKRMQRRSSSDPLELQKQTRQRRLQEYKKLKAVRASAMYRAWRSDFRKRVEDCAIVFDDCAIDSEAQLATLEAIVRAAKKHGWQVRHSSKHNGRASSRYIIVPNVGECRVSNHAIPETPERSWRSEEGYSPRWNGEVIIGPEWRTIGLTTWLRRILLAAAGR